MLAFTKLDLMAYLSQSKSKYLYIMVILRMAPRLMIICKSLKIYGLFQAISLKTKGKRSLYPLSIYFALKYEL